MRPLVLALAIVALAGCQTKDPVRASFESWWGDLSQTERSNISEPVVNLSDDDLDSYRLRPSEMEKDVDAAARFCNWWNTLSPGQIEGYAREVQARKIENMLAITQDERRQHERAAAEFRRATRTIRPASVVTVNVKK